MNEVDLALGKLHTDWANPSPATHRGELCPFKLQCSFDNTPVSEGEASNLCEELEIELPPELARFWIRHRSATLFEDVDYGQWGLEVLTPQDALTASRSFSEDRKRDVSRGDLVIGRFLGDSDLLLIRCDPSAEDFGSVVVALPLDDRSDWPHIAKNFGVFLDEYERKEGDKHWEVIPTR